MVVEVQIAIAVLIFLGGVILGSFLRPKPKSSGRLIVDQTGEKERWTFMIDDNLDEVVKRDVIFLDIDRRA